MVLKTKNIRSLKQSEPIRCSLLLSKQIKLKKMRSDTYQTALQQPIDSGYNASSTASDVINGIDLSGKTGIVTGGNTGIGLETTKVLASAGATVIVLARDMNKARKNLEGIVNVELETMDLMDPDSIDEFTHKFLATGRPLHFLINNAGIMWVPLRRDIRGIESQLATNYLAQFHLTARLWPALKKAEGARVINLSSQGHQFASFNFKDPNFTQQEYDTLQAYGQSKTASNLFSLELDKRGKASKVRSFSVHPGSIGGTELAREASLELFQKMGFCDSNGTILPEVAARLKSIAQGAATTVWCATNSMLTHMGGVYCEDVNIAEITNDTTQPGGVRAYSVDPANAAKLWTLSEEMIGIKFTTH